MFRRILCLFGFHEFEKQKDPFGFGDIIDVCQHYEKMDVEITVQKIN